MATVLVSSPNTSSFQRAAGLPDPLGVTMTSSDLSSDQPPPVLHRYRPPDEVECGRLEDLLVNHRIWATSPVRFNDPFDCRVRIDFQGTKAQWRKFYEKHFAGRHELTPAQQNDAVRAAIKSRAWKDPRAHANFVGELQAGVDAFGVICLCESATIPLMWAHYTSGHRGICLRFNTTAFPFSQVWRVRYGLSYPSLSILAAPGNETEAFLLSKAEWWRYEGEWTSAPSMHPQWNFYTRQRALTAMSFSSIR
jgi:hypothetical protein